jgi:putative multicomponent Na+:H+ antiporter subunit B
MSEVLMSEDLYVVAIAALLPLTALMLVLQVNPYNALVIRGILGAVAALVYALFGAADVALTEALVGTMLSITLYAVAVRSSMSMRLGVVAPGPDPEDGHQEFPYPDEPLLSALRTMLKAHHMRLERVAYPGLPALRAALQNKEIHAICISMDAQGTSLLPVDSTEPYHIQTRLWRLYELLQSEIPPTMASLSYVQPNRMPALTVNTPEGAPTPLEGHL